MITKEEALEIIEKFKFFEGQRAGRELWAIKPKEVQEEDLASFKRDCDALYDYILSIGCDCTESTVVCETAYSMYQPGQPIILTSEGVEKLKASISDVDTVKAISEHAAIFEKNNLGGRHGED